MPKNNIYLPKENYKKVELVQELEKYEIKKSPLSVAAKSKVINKSGSSYVSENKDDYGPGNSQSNSFSLFPPFPGSSGGGDSYRHANPLRASFERERREQRRNEELNRAALFVTETAIKATAVTTLTTMTGGLAPFIGGGAWIGGKWLESKNSEFLQFLGKNVGDLGGGMFSSGLFANSTVGELARKNGVDLKELESFYSVKGHVETGQAILEHNKHKEEGRYYKSNCELCNL